jgi:hypothetical protein
MADRCPECGATYPDPDDSCRGRFDVLLALDHSRREPWGSRHGAAFAVFALQHPAEFPEASQAQALELLTRVYRGGEPLAAVVRELWDRNSGARRVAEPPITAVGEFAVTIADLGDFDAGSYPEQLDAWCRATLDRLAPKP